MSRIFINGMSAKSGGGKSVLRNLLQSLAEIADGHEYVVAVPRDAGYDDLAGENVSLHYLDRAYSLPWLLWFSLYGLPKLLKKQRFDLLFNPSDIPTRTEIPQLFLFDWPYAAFPDSRAWKMGSLSERVVRHAKQWLFNANLKYINVLIAQSEIIAELLSKIYNHKNIYVVPNALSLDNVEDSKYRDYFINDKINLLCLSAYYPHKNIEIFIPLARLIKRENLPIRIIVTISPEQGSGVKKILKTIAEEDLTSVVHNVGVVHMKDVPSLYQQCHALLLPTLLESFSGTYVEAMFHKLPILTSDLPFAHGVCGESAIYFDPDDANDIFAKLHWMLEHPDAVREKVDIGVALLAKFPDWKGAAKKFIMLFDRTLAIEGVQSKSRD